jgi:hypothetical protein
MWNETLSRAGDDTGKEKKRRRWGHDVLRADQVGPRRRRARRYHSVYDITYSLGNDCL